MPGTVAARYDPDQEQAAEPDVFGPNHKGLAMAQAFPALFMAALAAGISTLVLSIGSEWRRVAMALSGSLDADAAPRAAPEKIMVSTREQPALKPVPISICRI